MKLSTYSARDYDDKLTGRMLIDISDKDEAKVIFVLEYIAEHGGFDIAYCPCDEDGIYSDSIGCFPSELKEIKELYKNAKQALKEVK